MDAAISINSETAYGVAATGSTEGYEGQGDSWKASREFVESLGFRAGMETVRADRRRIVDMGGEGEIECSVLDSGAGSLLRAVFDSLTVATGAAGAPSTLSYRTATTAGSPSYTVQMIRPLSDGGRVAYRHVGAVVTEWEFEQEVEKALTLKASFDFQTVNHTGVEAEFLPITYPAESIAYDWTRGAVYLTRSGAETLVPVGKWSLKGARGLKTDRRAVRANPLKRQPKRAELPEYEGEIEAEFESATLPLYEDFVGGAIVGLRISYTGVTKSGNGTTAKLDIVVPAIQFTGESPEASLDDLTSMTLPFRALDPGRPGTVSLTYVEPSGVDPTKPPTPPGDAVKAKK
ncbi:phage tail tube protein [Allokutzneria sp. A3M-2-11 16]|uniref:phage tail tube protein n=1 Tax=Allokutzneria sp. A3M-2-11 16 TaxID=2962043 RepID=UPI0020B81192|nr:phage tail tube protein [Allokutzneria sp. A3M-2-11 16]MCP3800197.1 phage tail tube protein [Allokutzneria sp. A3M-2-11 16]